MGTSRFAVFKFLAWAAASFALGFTALGILKFEEDKKLMPHGHSMLPSIPAGVMITATRRFGTPERGDIFVVHQDKTEMPTERKPDGPYIKRIVGIPGDHMEFNSNDGSVYSINNRRVNYQETSDFPKFNFTSTLAEMPDASIAVDAYTIELDNLSYPAYLADRKVFAHSSVEDEFAQLVFTYPWLELQDMSNGKYQVQIPEGHYFVSSDNFIGEDSRHFGLIHKSALISKFKG